MQFGFTLFELGNESLASSFRLDNQDMGKGFRDIKYERLAPTFATM
jgi:hypothetical protein